MGKKVGIWIDHRKAVLVILEKGKERNQIVKSDIEKHVRLAGGSRSSTPYGPQDVAAEGKFDRKYQHHLDAYYESVTEFLRDAESILIFGPGEAKEELERHIQRSKELGSRVKGVQRADKMTDRQIAARVRMFFKA